MGGYTVTTTVYFSLEDMHILSCIISEENNQEKSQYPNHIQASTQLPNNISAAKVGLELCRYIVLNPLRAGMVSDPGNYHWSSYQATMGRAKPQAWLNTNWVLAQFGTDRAQAQHRYEKFVRAGGGLVSVWKDMHAGLLLGSKAFLDSVAAQVASLAGTDEISRSQRLLNRPTLSALFPTKSYSPKAARNALILEAYLQHEYTMKAIAEHLDIHSSTVSKMIKNNQPPDVRNAENPRSRAIPCSEQKKL